MFDNSDHWEWTLDRDRLTLALVDQQKKLQYEIDLARCATPVELLARIAEASGKLFLSDRAVGALVRKLDELLAIEFTYCANPLELAPVDVAETIRRVADENERTLPILKMLDRDEPARFRRP